ncbi:hypothetical protein AAEY27_19145 [Kosakonia sp. BYX6]|uniref:Tox-PLDMTX domain-containing protein n=1 Tax=Kosakonia calanthes TaxID=3139408 RepID=A0ABZ3B4V6_9ENTR
MSDHDILPRILTGTAPEYADVFDSELPEAGFSPSAKYDLRELPGDIYEMFFDSLRETISEHSENNTKSSNQITENTKDELREFIAGALNQKLPQLLEYQEKGYNLPGLDKNALQKVQATLQKNRPDIPDALLKPAQRFTHILTSVVMTEETSPPELLQALPVVNAVIHQLGAALDDIHAIRKVSTLNWEDEVEQTARRHREQLVTGAADRLFQQDMPATERQAGRQWIESLMFAQSNALSAEYKKFSLLKESLLTESRITRQRLTAHLQTRALSLLQGAREARAAALDMLLAESDVGQMSAEQIMHWSQGYQLYAGYLQAVDDAPDRNAIVGNPLIAAVHVTAGRGGSARAKLAGSIVPVAEALSAVAVRLLQEKQRTEPAPDNFPPEQKEGAGLTGTLKKYVRDRGRKKGRRIKATSAGLAQTTGSRLSRLVHKARHTLQRTPAVTEGTRQAITNTALLLLDEIQQAERRIKLLPGYAWMRQEAVQQQQRISREIADPQELPLLSELLSLRLGEEATRWQNVAENAARQIETLVAPLTRLADNTWANEFYFVLSDELRARPEPGNGEALSSMDETMTTAVEQLADIGRQLSASAVRLSGHGHEGGKALQEKTGHWLMALKTLKNQVKTQAIRLTGHAPDNFSRSGMLARGISEWAESLKQDYLADFPVNEQTSAGTLFDTLFTELLSGHRHHFADSIDLQGESLLKRVSIALKHAGEGTTVYPPTAEEILAGTRSVPADIQHWAEKKILTGALSAAVSGGFKLLTGPVSLPVRIALRGARTGWTLNRNLKAMSRVRLGEGPATGARNRLINQELSKLAFRLTLSLSPAGAYGVAATLVGSELMNGKAGYAKNLAKKVVADLPQEAMWFGLASGGYTAFNAAVRASAESAMQKVWEQAAREQREKIDRIIQQFSTTDMQEEEGTAEASQDETAETAEATDTTQATAQDESTKTGESEKPASAVTDEPQEEGKRITAVRRKRIKRSNLRGEGPGTGISLNHKENTWIPTAADDAKGHYPALPVKPESPASEGDKTDSDASSQTESAVKSPASTASTELNEQAKSWSENSAFSYTNMDSGTEVQIYEDRKTQRNYIYLNGLYWPVIITGNSTAVVILENNDQEQKKFVNIRKINEQWRLTPTIKSWPIPKKTAGNFSIETYIRDFFDTSHAVTFANRTLPKLDSGLYFDFFSLKFYILANGYYWHITPLKFNEKYGRETSQIIETGGKEHLDVVYNKGTNTWEPLRIEDDETDKNERTTNNLLPADLINEMKRWDRSSSVRPDDSGPGSEGEVYKDKTGRYYIYMQNRYWQFSWINDKVGGVTITVNGIRKFIILRKDNNQWQYFDEEIITDDFDMDILLSDLDNANLDSNSRAKIESLLWTDHFTSLDNFLRDVQKILEDAFYLHYEKPDSSELRDIIFLSNRISEFRKSFAYYQPDEDNAQNQYNWNEDLLALYREEFSNATGQSTYIYTARQALVAAEQAKTRVTQFNTATIVQEIKKRHYAITTRKADLDYWLTLPASGPMDKHLQLVQPQIDASKAEIKKHEIRITQLNSLGKQVLNRKAEYQKVIDNYEKNYKTANIGIDLAKKSLERQKTFSGNNDKLKITESSLIDLTLQKIAIRSALIDAYTTQDLDKLKVLSVAQTVIMQIIERHALGQELIEKISESSVKFPTLKNSYQDIEWSNTEAERIYNEMFPADDNAEANQLLAPLIYWLLKNKKDYNALRSADIDNVIDVYYTDAHSLNPLQQIKKMPAGYMPLSDLLGSEYFASDSEFYQQFITYKEKFSDYEASENTKSLLLLSDLSLNEITSKVKKRFYFNVLQSSDVKDKHDGAMLFIELEDGRWVFFSIFPDALFSRIFSPEEMMDNIWLRKIASLTPKKTHYHGIESVFLELFFNENFDPENKDSKTRKYHSLEARKNKELTDLIDNTLYKGSDDVTYNNPFKKQQYYGLTYDSELNSDQPQETLIETLNKAFRDVLNRSATNRKSSLYKSTIFQKITDVLVPFYAEIRGAINDPEHKVDAASIMLDVVGVCFVASQAGTKTASLLKNAKGIGKIIGEGTQKGLLGKELQKYVIKEMGKQGLISATKLAKISVNSLLDLVLPVNVESLIKISMPKKNLFSGFDNIINTNIPGAINSRGINRKYINTEISLDDLSETNVRGVKVYITKASGERKGNYYIKSDDNIYQIRWDDYAQTWRTVDPKNPGRFSYGEPVVYEDGKWVINKNYGGLRGGGINDTKYIMGEQPSREGLPSEKVTENLISTPDVDAQAHLNEIKKISELNSAISSPKEKCESVIAPVAKYMNENGFTDIRCRAMAIFVNGMDTNAGNHFLLIGTKEGKDYAFDITAGQFHGQFEELSGPIIMPEEMWAQKYANVTSERKLIIYADYDLAKTSDAKIDFGPYKYLSEGPNCQVPNAKVIKRPVWYFPKKTVDDPPAATTNTRKAGGTIRLNPVREAARRSRLTTQTSGVCWDYAVDLLENAELLGKGPATTLRTGIRQAARYQRESAASPGALDGLFASNQVINSQENLLHVKQGGILVFMEVDPNLPGKGPRPIHAMVSLGNGRFAGMKNSVLNSSFGDGKQILTAEQLGEFQNGTFRRRGNAQLPGLQLIAGRPKDLLTDSPSLKSLAENAALSVTDNTDIATTTAELLSKSGELAEEQASALKHALTPLLSSTSTKPVTGLLTDAASITKQQLATLPEGQLVIFDKTSDISSTRHVIYSLGNGEFFMVNPRHLDAGLPADKAIVRADQFSDEIFKNRKVYAGKISLTNLRVTSLLGQDAEFTVSGSKITLTAHGAPSSVNSLDATELAEVIRGLGLSEISKVDWAQIKEIELKSCFGAFGTLPTGKVLANILNKKVTAYPFYFSEKMRDTTNIITRARTYIPTDLSAVDLEKLMKQQSRNHNFWAKLLQLRQKIAVKRVRRSADIFENTLEDVAKLANGDITVEQFFKDYPDYRTGLSVTEAEFRAMITEAIPDDEAFAMRCWDILMLSAHTANMVNKYLEG